MSNRVAVLCDVNNMGYDQRNPALFDFVDYAHVYPYPEKTGDGYNSVAGFEGDAFFVKVPMRVENALVNNNRPVLNGVTISIVAIKNGENDFVIENKTFPTASACKFNSIQQLSFNGIKGYTTFDNDPFNNVSLVNAPQYNSGTKVGLLLQYSFVLRYDYWNNINPSIPGGSNCGDDINNDIKNVNNGWTNLTQNGWSLVLRVSSSVAGYDGFITTFQADTPIKSKQLGSDSDVNLQYVGRTVYYDDSSGSPVVIKQPKLGGITRVRIIWVPNGFDTSGIGNYFGSIFVDALDKGNVLSRRLASSEIPSENGSPFSDSGVLYLGVTKVPNQHCFGNLRIGWFSTGVNAGIVVTETNYDDSILSWSKYGSPLVFRIGFTPYPVVIADEDGVTIGDEDGNFIEED